MPIQHGAHASTLVMAGREYRIRREFELVCRVEERFGPLREFAGRLEEARFTVREMVDLYRLLLADQNPPVSDADIQAHVVQIGVIRAVGELHPISTAFFFGEEAFMKRVAEQADRSLGNPESPPLRAVG